jgi:hypothetical protein
MVQRHPRGQVLLLIVLIIAVVISVGLSIAARSIVNVRLATEEDESQRAFSAAEAGLDQSLLSDAGVTNGTFLNSASYNTAVIPVSGTDILLNNGKVVAKDEGIDVWLSEYAIDRNEKYTNQWQGALTVYWGKSGNTCSTSEVTNTMPAIEIIVLTGTKNAPALTHYVYDPCGARRTLNKFTSSSGGGTVGGQTFAYSATINVAASGLLARVIPLYANTFIAVRGNPGLPAQGNVIESTGTAGDVKRKITVLRENPYLPADFFSYSFLWPQ